MPEFTPTAEQQEALRLFATGEHLAIEAGAGCGKTATLRLLAESCPDRMGQYLAFNKAIVEEAGRKFPSNVHCSTVHSLAFRSVGKKYGQRLRNSRRMKSAEIARRLGVEPMLVRYGTETKPMAAGFLAGQVMRALEVFCQSADPEPSERHFPYIDGIDEPLPDGTRTWVNNRQVRDHLLPALRKAWVDAQDPNGQLPFKHSWYLKAFELSNPVVMADFILVDEAQDVSPVMASIVLQQRDRCQLVFVGDSAQQIYGFTGAVNALAGIRSEGIATAWLSASFRFGQAVADVANGLLERAGHELHLTGAATWASVVAPVPDPDCVLTRTNAEAVRVVLQAQVDGRRAAIMGGGTEVKAFAEAAADLMAGRWTSHPELACFSDWASVEDYVANDPQGGDLRLLVKLVNEFGTPTIIQALSRTVRDTDADIVASTAHKAKGCEWDSVQIAGDFMPAREEGADNGPEELRLMYVAATRARRELDLSMVPHFLAAPVSRTTAPAAVVATQQPVEGSDACPDCGRSGIIRGGLVGAHRCEGAEAAQ